MPQHYHQRNDDSYADRRWRFIAQDIECGILSRPWHHRHRCAPFPASSRVPPDLTYASFNMRSVSPAQSCSDFTGWSARCGCTHRGFDLRSRQKLERASQKYTGSTTLSVTLRCTNALSTNICWRMRRRSRRFDESASCQ